MKKFGVGGVVVIILIVLVYSWGVYAASGADTNYFNQHYRATLASRPFWRKVFRLHQTGDAKSDYLGSRYPNIVLEVDNAPGISINVALFSELAEKVRAVTGKSVTIDFSGNETRDTLSHGDSASIYILVSDAADDSTLLGMTHNESEIILFDTALRNFAAQSPATFNNYELSTALHEFGHLLGLSHNELPGCLMNSHAESDQQPKFNAADVVTNFCPYEQELLHVAH